MEQRLAIATPRIHEKNVIKAVPDRAQQPVRLRALQDGKLVYMAASKLAAAKPFYALDPHALPVSAAEAAGARRCSTDRA